MFEAEVTTVPVAKVAESRRAARAVVVTEYQG